MVLATLACVVLAGCTPSSAVNDAAVSRLEVRLARQLQAGDRDATAWHSDLLPTGVSAMLRLDRCGYSQNVLSAPDDTESTDPVASTEVAEAMSDRWWQKPLAGRSLGEVLTDDIKSLPRELWKGTKDSATTGNMVLLGLAGGLSVVSRGSWDDRVDKSFRNRHDGLFDKEGDFGSVIGSPLLHFGAAATTYVLGVQTGNDRLYGFSKTMLHALSLTGIATVGLKFAVNDYSPNGEAYAWPSGHTSSTATVAAVVWEEFGWQAGVPMYLLTGWVATSRLEDREHWLSDVIFGAVLGSVIGHSVAQGRALEVGGFTVLPYVHPEGGAGVAFMKEF
jgi:PAP2 superfamily